MAISKEKEKTKIIKEYALHEGDTGSPEVQIAVLTYEINHLMITSVFIKKTSTQTVD